MQQSPQVKLLKNVLFIDIETVSCVEDYEKLSDVFKPLWDKKSAQINKAVDSVAKDAFFEKAGIYSEFGKVIVIGLGFVTFSENNEPQLRVKALYGHDEKVLLQSFKDLIEKHFEQDQLQLCGHNGKEFDFPYLCRRMVVNGITLPKSLDMSGKKPWENRHLDTMEMWSFGDRKNFTSLHLLATLFEISSSKDLMDGSQVNHVYYKEHDIDKIAQYCMQDVIVTVQVFFRMNFWDLIMPKNIKFA